MQLAGGDSAGNHDSWTKSRAKGETFEKQPFLFKSTDII